jgi:hypothetical protein
MDRSAVVSIEQIEREAWLDLFSVAPAQFVNDWGAQSARLPAAAVFGLREAPLVEFNRALGIGVEQQPSEEELDRVTAWLRTHGNSAWALQIAPVARSEALLRWMEHSGLKADGSGVAKFQLGLSQAADYSLQSDFEIHAVEPHDAALFGTVVQAGFDAPPAFASWFSGLVGRPKWRIYLAYDGTDPVASGAMFIDRGWAWTGIDATLPASRRRGHRRPFCLAGSLTVLRRVLRDLREKRIGQSWATKRLKVPTAIFFGPAFMWPTPGTISALHRAC